MRECFQILSVCGVGPKPCHCSQRNLRLSTQEFLNQNYLGSSFTFGNYPNIICWFQNKNLFQMGRNQQNSFPVIDWSSAALKFSFVNTWVSHFGFDRYANDTLKLGLLKCRCKLYFALLKQHFHTNRGMGSTCQKLREWY